MDKEKQKMRYCITCSQCGRLYKRFIPIPVVGGIAVVWCVICSVVLCRFDLSDKEYDEGDF